MPNPSYLKGARFERKIREELEKHTGEGSCKRAHMSGAYTGEPDLKWLWDLRYWTVDCKSGDGWEGKRHRARLEKADICIDGPDRKIPIVTLTLPKLLELMGCKGEGE